MLAAVLVVAGVALLLGARANRLPLPPQVRRGGAIAGVVLLVLSAYERASSGTEFLQFTILGVALGCIYAIAAAGLVLTYTTTGVFNFAHGALGMIAGFIYWQMVEEWDLPSPLAAAFVLLLVGPLLGLVLELMFRRFRDADIGTSIVLTIAVTVLCIGLAQYFFKATEAHNLGSIFGQRTVTIFDATITWDNVLQIGVAVAIAVGLRALLYVSRMGTAMRAVVDNPTLAALNGASPTSVAKVSWVLGTDLAIVAGILFAGGTNLEAITLTFFVVNAYGAAVFGKLRSLPLTFAGAIVLGIIQNWSGFWFPKETITLGIGSFDFFDIDWRRVNVSLPGIFLFASLLFLPQAKLTVGRVVGRATPRVPSLPSSLVRAAAFVGAVALLAQVIPDARMPEATRAVVYGVLLLSLVLLTGYSGQVSLTQYVFMALGGFAMGETFGGDSVLGLVAAGLIAIPVGALVALPALRLQGLYLALVTFGFASVARDLLIQDRHLFGEGPVAVGRLDLFGISFAGDEAFLVLCAAVFALMGVGVLAIKRGPFGRRLAAMRDSQAACATLGLDVRVTKMVVFCASAAMAGVAGALFGGFQRSISDISFEPINNIVLFLFAVVGGITTVSGALIGGTLFALLPYVQAEKPELAGLVFAGIAAVAIGLGRQPNGLAGILTAALDRWLDRSPGGTTTSTTPGPRPVPEEVPVGAAR
ncbi:MAG TPA: ABC transporter permease [Acidimicrobiales bacterium]|nr:ABC transporter permease [Acidimicrobiales bacterium]